MNPLMSRLTLMADEWLWIYFVVRLFLLFEQLGWTRRRKAFWWAFVLIGAFIIYGIGYPMHWRLEREWQGVDEPAAAMTILARSR